MAFILQNARAYSFCGPIEYIAPEIVKGGSQGHDMVSLASPVCPVVQEDVWHGPVDISDGPRPEVVRILQRFMQPVPPSAE
jgi:hypothetical protein